MRLMMPELAILYLHALPLDGTMWNLQRGLSGIKSYAPTLYGFGNTVSDWAQAALDLVEEPKVIVVGCSVGGSCALEIAHLAPQRVAALVLVGTKADITLQPEFLASALDTLLSMPPEAAWIRFWRPLICEKSPRFASEALRWIFDRQSPDDLARGITAFHTRPSRKETLGSYDGEIVMVSGENDVAPGPLVSRRQAEAAQHGSLHIVPQCGHYVPVEASGIFNRIVTQLLERQLQTPVPRFAPAIATSHQLLD